MTTERVARTTEIKEVLPDGNFVDVDGNVIPGDGSFDDPMQDTLPVWNDPDGQIPWEGRPDDEPLVDLSGTNDQELDPPEVPLPEFDPSQPVVELGGAVNGPIDHEVERRLYDTHVWNLLNDAIIKAEKKGWLEPWIDGVLAKTYIDRRYSEGRISAGAYNAMKVQLEAWKSERQKAQSLGGVATSADPEEYSDGKMRAAGD